MYESNVGPIPDGMQVLHRCDNPRCVNPDHLFLGTVSDNMKDRSRKGRLDVHGSKNPCSKLTELDVFKIKLALHSGETCASIARRYPVTDENIRHIKKNRKWQQVHLGLDGIE